MKSSWIVRVKVTILMQSSWIVTVKVTILMQSSWIVTVKVTISTDLWRTYWIVTVIHSIQTCKIFDDVFNYPNMTSSCANYPKFRNYPYSITIDVYKLVRRGVRTPSRKSMVPPKETIPT